MSEMRTIQPKNLEIAGANLNGQKFKPPGKKFRKFWYTSRGFPLFFLEILDDSVPCATGSCQKFKPDVLVEWKAPWAFSPFVSLSYLVISCS